MTTVQRSDQGTDCGVEPEKSQLEMILWKDMTDDDIDLLIKLANERPTPAKTPQDLRLEWVEQRIEWIATRLKWIDDFEKKAILKGLKRDRDVKMSQAA